MLFVISRGGNYSFIMFFPMNIIKKLFIIDRFSFSGLNRVVGSVICFVCLLDLAV